jgi:hypothetical protein
MLNLPIQSAPINRTRVTRGSVAAASGGISASQLGIPLVAPFASDDAISPSLNLGGLLQVGPFAREDAVSTSAKITDWLSIGPFVNGDAA